MKKCPFRKKILRTDYNTYGTHGIPGFDYVEEFEECIGEECMAHYTYSAKPYWDAQYEKDYDGCELMTRREY
jgi:hypothetical protein